MDFNKEDGEQLYKMLKARHPDDAIMKDWKNDIVEKLTEGLSKEGFSDEQIRKVVNSVWAAFGI